MLSQFFILSGRGDTVVGRDYRHDVPRTSHDTCFRLVTCGAGVGDGEAAPPVILHDGVNYFHIKASGLLFCATSRENLSPSLVLELLLRVARVIKDYCGVLTEESLRKNFVLVYELLDEMVDYGYGQSTSTEALKASVFNDPVTPPQPLAQLLRPGILSGDTRAPPSAMLRSVLSTGDARRGGAPGGGGPLAAQGGASGGGSGRSEIFVDIIERLTVTFNGAGYMLTSELDGAIQCKSFLAGNPQIKMALNEDLAVTASSAMPYEDRAAASAAVGGLCFLDDVAFHERVSLDEFETDRTLLLTPPAGEFTVMNYRSSAPFKAPFRVTPSISEPAPYKLEVTVHVRTEFPGANAAVGVTLRVPLPKSTSHVSLSTGDSSDASRFGAAEFDEAKKELVWTLKRFPGGQERSIRCKCTLTTERVASIKKEVGPVALSFTLPNFHVSGLNVRYLQIQAKSRAGGAEPPARWVRYVTTSSSYVCRL